MFSFIWLGIIGSVAYHLLMLSAGDTQKISGEILRGAGLFFMGIGIAPLGLLLAAARTQTSQEQSDIEKQRLVSEDFSHSVRLLGDNSAAVRQGGIYALGFLAQENKERYETVIKIVASFVRETKKREPRKEGEIIIARDGVDVEAALSVIRNRDHKIENIHRPEDKQPYLFDLSNADLLNGDLSNTAFRRINMSDMKAEGCVFANTKFAYTNMVGAKFIGCDFFDTAFIEVNFQRADSNDSGQGKTQFIDCDFSRAGFYGANFEDVELRGAKLYGADLREVRNLTQAEIDSSEGDIDTKIPDDLDRPDSWHREAKYPNLE